MPYAGLPGGGPWAILTQCPASQHNSQRAASGRRDGVQCICPRAKALHKQMVADRNTHGRSEAWRESRFLHAGSAPPSVPMPDMSRGACRTNFGQAMADRGMDISLTSQGVENREQAKGYCELYCPILERCRSYVLAAESPKGSWGGVWGGLDPWNRRGKQVVMVNGRAEVVNRVHT